MPLLIGGATTSQGPHRAAHRSAYNGPVVHVLDASRARRRLLGAGLGVGSQAEDFAIKVAAEYEAHPRRARRRHQSEADRARGRPRQRLRRSTGRPTRRRKPAITGTRRLRRVSAARSGRAHRLDAVLPRLGTGRQLSRRSSTIRWSATAPQPLCRCAADARPDHAREVADGRGRGRLLAVPPRGRRRRALQRRQRAPRRSRASPSCASRSRSAQPRANMCLADFISPEATGSAASRYGIHGIEPHLARFKADHDDYSDILLKALADRLAEAFAERLHQHVRNDAVGLCARRAADQRGADPREVSRHPPGAGLSRLPRPQPEARPVRLLNAGQNAGITLTESFAMLPTSAVSGYYFAHPEASISASPASAATSSRTMRRVAA